ncbi:hypothetical protein CP532_2197 [Ophiocordyceps camponoti-leonardi (nom. inval.)]|nr:hypothetical protein CP532_2197 [Ophiocordyceps camponoti-leonardi (nom. inval.)]
MEASKQPLPRGEEKIVVEDGLQQKTRRQAIFYMLAWIVCSNGTILFNKWIMDSAGFKFPISLTCGHLIFTSLATQLLARTTRRLDSRRRLPLTRRTYIRAIVPIGIFYSASLMLSNISYLHLSVAFIQMLKAASPIATLLMSWAWGLADPSLTAFLNIIVIVIGAALSSLGDVSFSVYGFSTQVAAIVFEAVRIVMIQHLLSDRGFHIEPLVGLYYYAPICAVFTFLFALKTEFPLLDFQVIQSLGFSVFFLNAAIAFMVNVTSVLAIKKTSGLVMTLTGITKNVILIIISAAIWQTYISPLQAAGYTITLIGLFQYSFGFENLVKSTAIYIPLRRGRQGFFAKGDVLRKLISTVFVVGTVVGTAAVIVLCSDPSPSWRPLH